MPPKTTAFAYDTHDSTSRKDAPSQDKANALIAQYSLRADETLNSARARNEATQTAAQNRALNLWMGYSASQEGIDRDSDMRLAGETTANKHRTPMPTRTFVGVPNLGKGDPNPRVESRLQNGQDTAVGRGPGTSVVAEKQFPVFHPEVRAVDVEHIVPPWSRGGENSRDASKDPRFLKSVGYELVNGRYWARKRTLSGTP